MAVQGVGPDADFRNLRDVGPGAPHLYVALLERARTVVQRAREAVALSQQQGLLGEWMREPLVARCAWCGRCRVADQWVDVQATRSIPATRTTHSICGNCVEALRESGLSA